MKEQVAPCRLRAGHGQISGGRRQTLERDAAPLVTRALAEYRKLRTQHDAVQRTHDAAGALTRTKSSSGIRWVRSTRPHAAIGWVRGAGTDPHREDQGGANAKLDSQDARIRGSAARCGFDRCRRDPGADARRRRAHPRASPRPKRPRPKSISRPPTPRPMPRTKIRSGCPEPSDAPASGADAKPDEARSASASGVVQCRPRFTRRRTSPWSRWFYVPTGGRVRAERQWVERRRGAGQRSGCGALR